MVCPHVLEIIHEFLLACGLSPVQADKQFSHYFFACPCTFQLPKVVSCGTFKDRLVEAELWMSSGGTSSSLHSHNDHNIHCVLDGRKDFILIESKHKDAFKYKETVSAINILWRYG